MVDSTASDRKTPIDANAQSTPMTNLDKILMALVSIAIIVFVVFQSLVYVNGRSDPVVQFDSNYTEARKFPGMLVCPFSIVQRSAIDAIRDRMSPDWSPDAILSIDTPVSLLNTNVDAASNRQDPKTCPSNNIISAFPDDRDGLPHLYYNGAQKPKKVLVKNGAKPLTIKGAGTMNSWTPPNVECFIFDHRLFTVESNPVCNPMVETRANSADSLLLSLGGRSDRHAPEYTYTYTGLKPSGPSDRPYPTPTSSKNATEMQSFFYNHWHASVFGGVLVAFYDSSKERPASLNFDGALTNSLSVPDSTQVLHSAVLLSTACQGNPCLQKLAPFPFTAEVTNEFNTLLDSSTSITQSVTISTSIIDQKTFTIDNQNAFFADVTVHFAASYSTKRTQVERVALLTVLSVILSTAATIWKSQSSIKEFIEMAIKFIEKRRARVSP